MPRRDKRVFASSIISRVRREVITAFDQAAPRSPAATAFSYATRDLSRASWRLAISARLISGGGPSNTKTGAIPKSSSAA